MTLDKTYSSIAGHPLTIRIIFDGDKYGLDDCLTHDISDNHPRTDTEGALIPMVEFISNGFMISRYYWDTLYLHSTGGLCLDGGRHQYNIGSDEYTAIINDLRIEIGSRL